MRETEILAAVKKLLYERKSKLKLTTFEVDRSDPRKKWNLTKMLQSHLDLTELSCGMLHFHHQVVFSLNSTHTMTHF
jgi:hypothetical protein